MSKNESKKDSVKMLTVGQYRSELVREGKDVGFHEAASSLHNWESYAHHNGKEKTLSAADYLAAIKAASNKMDRKYIPHAPALFKLGSK